MVKHEEFSILRAFPSSFLQVISSARRHNYSRSLPVRRRIISSKPTSVTGDDDGKDD